MPLNLLFFVLENDISFKWRNTDPSKLKSERVAYSHFLFANFGNKNILQDMCKWSKNTIHCHSVYKLLLFLPGA